MNINGSNQLMMLRPRISRFTVALVHIELKRRGVALKEAFNQIERYQRDSFWVASGLYEYVQLFVISNGTRTEYYSNTTRISAIKERYGKKKVQKTN